MRTSFPHCFFLRNSILYGNFAGTEIQKQITMKTKILKTLTVFVLLIASTIGVGLAESREVILIKVPFEHIDEDPIEVRIPSRPIQCTISEEGIFIQGYDASEILYYVVYDLEGACLLVTDDTHEFTVFLLSLQTTGNVEIRMKTLYYVLRGML